MLNRLRNLDDSAKKKVVVSLASFFSFIIFIFWGFYFYGFAGSTVMEGAGKSAQMFGQIKSDATRFYRDIQNKFKEINSPTQSTEGSMAVPSTTSGDVSTSTIE